MYCHHCGKQNGEGVRFCVYCGSDLIRIATLPGVPDQTLSPLDKTLPPVPQNPTDTLSLEQTIVPGQLHAGAVLADQYRILDNYPSGTVGMGVVWCQAAWKRSQRDGGQI
jgi:hypothetical protein